MRLALIFLAFTGCVAASETGSYDRALSLYNHTEYQGAIALLRQDAGDARSLTLLGRSLLMNAEYGKAVEALERAVAREPNNSTTVLWLGRAYGRRAENSFAFAAMGWASKARKAFERAYRLDPSNSEAQDDLFDYYVQAPEIVGGGLDKARSLIPVIAQRDPAEADFARARVEEETKEYHSAEAHLRRALELAPQQVGRVLDLAKFLSKQDRFEESDRVFEQAARMAPDSPAVLYSRAESYVRSKRNLAQARDLLNRYLAARNRTPDDPPAAEARKLLSEIAGQSGGAPGIG